MWVYLFNKWENMTAAAACYTAYIIWACVGLIFWEDTFWFYILMWALLFDTITWIAKAVRFNRFKSNDMIWWTISKIFMIWIVILFAVIMQAKFPDSIVPSHVLSWLIWFIVIAECISIIQNTMMVKTWVQIEERDAVTYFLNALLDKLRKSLQSIKE